jgi:hypothetical protein
MENSIRDPWELEFVIQMFHTFNHQCVRQENLCMLEQLKRARDTSAPTTGTTVVLAAMVLPPARGRQREGTDLVEVQGQEQLKTLNGLEKLDFLLSKEAKLFQMASGDKEKLNPSSKR